MGERTRFLAKGRRPVLFGIALFGVASACGGALASGSESVFRERTPPALRSSAAQRREANQSLPLSLDVVRTALRHELGSGGVVQLDHLSRTPRLVARLDGFLTRPSHQGPAQVALHYVDAHRRLFGLRVDEMRELRLARSWSASGYTHLVFAQEVGGIPVASRGLVANVAADGRLINIGGSPIRHLRANTRRPVITARQALFVASRSERVDSTGEVERMIGGPRRERSFAGGSSAKLVLMPTVGKARLAWRVLLTTRSRGAFSISVDAVTGGVLRRESLTRSVSANVYRYFPGSPIDGASQTSVDFTPYISNPGSPYLSGNFAYAFTDVNDDGTIQTSEDISPSSGVNYLYSRAGFSPSGLECPAVGCSWNPAAPFSWQTNLKQQAVQAFYFVNKFHDHLLQSPIGFTAAKGNFEGDARVWVNVDPGANSNNTGLPDGDHVNNSFMTSYPTGTTTPPVALMALFLVSPGDAGVSALDTAGDASVVYHEYTHGLTNRLVADADGVSMLNGPQGRALDEGWADWYSLDFLAAQGYATDTAASGEVKLAPYVTLGGNVWRTQGVDCPVGAAASACPGAGAALGGGYTYGDMGKIESYPEPHADGEIWSETLWDLRARLIAKYGAVAGISRADLLVTRGLELTPGTPTFLDARDAILQADTVFDHGADQSMIWEVFAQRGMGYFASARDSADVRPTEDFRPPPVPGSGGTLSGTVEDDGGAPIGGARVWVGGHDSGLLGNLAATTDLSGHYTIPSVPPGTYHDVFAEAVGGYDVGNASEVTVAAGAATSVNFELLRDWASTAAGSTIASVTGPDFSPDCGPARATDSNPVSAWMTSSPARADDPGPKAITIRLPRPIDVSAFAIDPTTDQDACSEGVTSSLGAYLIETSSDGVSFMTSASGTFAGADDFRLNVVTPGAGTTANVRYVRLTGVSTQNSSAGFRGAVWMGVTAVEVHGAPTELPGGPPPVVVGPKEAAPGPPENVRAVARDRRATVKWEAPRSNGGSAITGYELIAYRGRTGVRTMSVGTATRVAVGGLTNGRSYRFRVAAKNAIGTGSQSSASNAVTPQAPACVVPRLVGAPLRSAKARIKHSHCRTGHVGFAFSRVRKGVVIAQSRRPGLRARGGLKIDLEVSRGRRQRVGR